MSRVTYFPRYTNPENVVTNTTLHLFSQINQHSTESFQALLGELLGDEYLPLGINFQQQTRAENSVPDGSILQERVHILIETKVTAGVNIDQLKRHCAKFQPGQQGNYLLLLTKEEQPKQVLAPIEKMAKDVGAAFCSITFEALCNALKDFAKEHETHLRRVVQDYADYCAEMSLLPDRRKWMRIVPCGMTFPLNEQWHCYYQPTERSYSPHDFIGVYTNKAVRLFGRVAAIYDSSLDPSGKMQLSLVHSSGVDRPEFRQSIENMARDSKAKVGWNLESDTRFFCVEKFQPTEFKKTSYGGIQGPRFWDISAEAAGDRSDTEIAARLSKMTWE